MNTQKTNLTQIWTATYEWLEIAERQGFEIDWNSEPLQGAEYDAACELAGLDPDDLENGAALIVSPRDCDTLLRPGDLVMTSGPGGDVAFLRRS